MPMTTAARIEVREPPALPRQEGASGAWLGAIPMLGSLGAVVMVSTTSGGSGRHLVAAGGFLLATVGFVLVQVDRARRRHAEDLARSRRAYLRHLDGVREQARAAAGQQREQALADHPPPWGYGPVATPSDAGAPTGLPVRVGTAPRSGHTALVSRGGRDDGEEPDPVCLVARDRLLAAHRTVDGLPVTLDLAGGDRITLTGSGALALARAVLVSAARRHPAARLRIAVLTDTDRLPAWDWVKWLPHVASPTAYDVLGPRRMVGTTPAELARLLDHPASATRAAGEEPWRVLLVDDRVATDAPAHERRGDTTVLRVEPRDGVGTGATTVLQVGVAGRLVADPPALLPEGTVADGCSTVTAEAAARKVATTCDPSPATHVGSARLLGLEPGTSVPQDPACRLRTPIGVDPEGEPVELDLSESALGGVGPHGLLVGATGSGKSELLRTLVLGLAVGHSPADLNLVLVDFKGGATFAELAHLPHTAALITNLAGERDLVDRMEDALGGELVRRQEVLRASGHESARSHEADRLAGRPLPPLPSLLVVVDEFSELLTLHPDLAELFAAIGRLGRSLGVHLLLASQRLDEGRLRGLESHLSYRIALRTFSAGESRAVIGTSDAHLLPPAPGSGYLRAGPDRLQRFRAACVSDPVPRGPEEPVDSRVLPHVLTELTDTLAAAHHTAPPAPVRTTLQAGLAALDGAGPAARPIWLPPLTDPPSLGHLLDEVTPHLPARGLLVPVGVLDRPREQRRDPLLLDLAHAGGQVAVVGGPRSGKSTLVQTIAAGTALRHPPTAAQVFVLDPGGGCAPLRDLPHTCGYATRTEPELARHLVAEVRRLMERRERLFRDRGVGSVDDLRRPADGAGDGTIPDEGYGDGYGEVHLLVDGWGLLREEQEDLADEITSLAARAPALGVHLILSAGRWTDLRPALRDLIGTRLELRLGDPFESEVCRRTAVTVPPGRPGRGIVGERLHFLTALPCLDPDGTTDDLAERAGDRWPGRAPTRLRPLPRRLPPSDLGRDGREPPGLLLGVGEGDLAAIGLAPEDHLLVTGPPGAGRTHALRTVLVELVRADAPGRAQVLLVDPRRGLGGLVPEDRLLHHLVGGEHAAEVLHGLADWLRDHLPTDPALGPGRRPGAAVHVVVDDHDLLVTGGRSILEPLLPLLPHAQELGLRLVLARRTGAVGDTLVPATPDRAADALSGLAAPELALTGDPPGRARLTTRRAGTRLLQVVAPS